MPFARLLQPPRAVPCTTTLEWGLLRGQGGGVGASRTPQGWGTGYVWVGTRQPLLDGLWGGHGQGSPPHRWGGLRLGRRHFSQDLPALQWSRDAGSPLSHALRLPPSLMATSALPFLAALVRRQPRRQAGMG